jgi:hypothetical protein
MSTETKNVKRGRPVVTTSKRQERETAKAAKIAAGEVIRRGRPKGSGKQKVETVAVAE